MKRIIILVCIIASFICSACNPINKEAVTTTTNQLFDAIKLDSESRMVEVYPDVKKLPSYYKSDKIAIKEIQSIGDKKAKVEVESEYTTGLGKLVTTNIILYLKPDSFDAEKYIVYDSEGLCGAWNHKENNKYKYALKTGCIDEKVDITDLQRAEKMKAAGSMFMVETFSTYLKLMTEIKFELIDYDASRYSVSGKARCINNSEYDIAKINYTIKCLDMGDDVIGEDDGRVTYDVIKAGRSKVFSFYCRTHGYSWDYKFVPDFDFDEVERIVAEKDYTGHEYEEFIKKMESEEEDKEKATEEDESESKSEVVDSDIE